jgi:hypothetical protein
MAPGTATNAAPIPIRRTRTAGPDRAYSEESAFMETAPLLSLDCVSTRLR